MGKELWLAGRISGLEQAAQLIEKETGLSNLAKAIRELIHE